MAKITVNVEDEYMDEFLEELQKIVDKECDNERCVTIFGLTVKEYKKHCIKDKK